MMNHRLQVLVSPELDAQIQKAAKGSGISKGEWVRHALNAALRTSDKRKIDSDPVARLAALNGPTADIGQMLAEIAAGRS